MDLEGVIRERSKESDVILAAGRLFQMLLNAVRALPRFMIEYRGIERFFAGKMPKDDWFADAGAIGDLLGGCTAESFFREQLGGDGHNLPASVLGRHPGLASTD